MWHCLPGDAKVLTEYGVWVEIKELKNKSLKVKCFDRKTGNLVDTEIEEFFEVSKKERMFEIKTQSGFKICVTEDHPILTKKGYLTPTVLSENDFVTINPFTGVDYSKLDDSVLVEEETIRKIYDSDKFSIDEYFDHIRAPIQLHQGTADDAVPVEWSNLLSKRLLDLNIDLDYFTYSGSDHNLSPAWDTVVSRDIEFFKKNLK